MNPDIARNIKLLEELWDGPLSRIRDGEFSLQDERQIVDTLSGINIEGDELVPRSLVTLLWFIPQFMEWQIPRVAEKTELDQKYRNLCLWVSEDMGRILGNP